MRVGFIIAHPDDEAYGPYGTIVQHIHNGDDVVVMCLCNGYRPGTDQDLARARVDAFKVNIENAGARWKIWDNNDLTLEPKAVTEFVDDLIRFEKLDVIYTHNISDINRDHRIIAEACLVGSRPKPNSTVNELYFFEVPSSTDWTFSQVQPVFEPNTYKEISTNVMLLKEVALGRYDSETYDFPDARSIEAMVTLAKYRGYQVGFKYAEAFKLVFSKTRN